MLRERFADGCLDVASDTRQRERDPKKSNEPVIVIQGGVIRLRRRGHQRVRRQRVCVRT